MIAGIDHQIDIVLYLESNELEELLNNTIEGILVKSQNPKRQGTINISVNNARKDENGFGIGLNDKKYWGVQDKFHIDVFMGKEWYEELRENGVIGTRHKMRSGSKIHIYDKSELTRMEATMMEGLEFYRDNKEKLLE